MTAYLASLLAAWAGMGMFCLRSDAIRHRYNWPRHDTRTKRQRAMIAGLLCGLSLGFALNATLPSFALILWLVQLGGVGISIALLLPYLTAWLPVSFRLAGIGATGLGLVLLLLR